MKSDNRNREYGHILFPDSGKRIEDVWLTITDTEIYFECSYQLSHFETFPIICGVFNGMNAVTFVDVFTSGGQSGGAGSFRKFVVTWMLKNKHFSSINALKFKKIGFREEALKNWSREPFSLERTENSYTFPEPICPVELELDSFKLIWELAHYIQDNREEVSITQTSTIISKFKDDIGWNLIIDHILKVKKFILFLTNKNPELSNFYLNGGVELIFVFPVLNEPKFPTHIELDYNEVKINFTEIAKLWFENPKLEPISDLILEKHFNVQIPPHRHFFNLSVGLEAFHEKFILKNVPLKDEEIKVRRLEIKESIENEELKQWFSNRSNEWVKPSLKDRLFDIQESIEKVSSGIFDLSTEEFITKIKQTRDDIAHAGIFYKRFESRIELMIVTKIVEFTLRIEVYKMFGLKDSDKMYNQANKHCKRLALMNGFEIAEKK